MTGDRKHRTLKDQLEAEIADMERRVADDPDRLYGGDWFQLTDAEEVSLREYHNYVLNGFWVLF
jgi:hypothetical protein